MPLELEAPCSFCLQPLIASWPTARLDAWDGWNASKEAQMAKKYPGVRPLGNNRYEIRATHKDAASGKTKEAIRTVQASCIEEAALLRKELRDSLSAAPVEEMTVKAYCRSWLERRRDGANSADGEPLRRGTLMRYAQHLDRFCEAFGHMPISSLTPFHIKEWLAREAKRPSKRSKDGTVSGYTVLGMLRTVRTVTADAKVDLGLASWCCERVASSKATPEYTEEDPNALTPAQLEAMWTAMRETEPEWFPLFAFMADTGVRFCHAHCMEWTDLDLEVGTYRINRSRYRGEVNPPSKRKSGHHSGALPAELVAVLREHRDRAGGTLAFPSPVGGGYIDHKSFSRAVHRARVLAGIPFRLTPHGCRRTMATLADSVVGEGMAQKLLGHATKAMTRRYVAVDIEAKRQAIETVVALRKAGTQIGTENAGSKATDWN